MRRLAGVLRGAHGRRPGSPLGLHRLCAGVARATSGDTIIAYQTDRNELVGLARMVKFKGTEVYLEAVEKIGTRVRPLKKADTRIAVIPALQPGPIQTIYAISDSDGNRLVQAARVAVGKS
jgi:hypothetical protein